MLVSTLLLAFNLHGYLWKNNILFNKSDWEGIRLVELKQSFKANDTTQYSIANDVLFIMPVGMEPMIKFVYEGDTQTYQVQDAGTNMDMTFTQEVQTKLGIGVVTNQKFGVWKIVAS